MTAVELTIYILALVGVGACSISGAAAAIKKELDLFGVMFIAAARKVRLWKILFCIPWTIRKYASIWKRSYGSASC